MPFPASINFSFLFLLHFTNRIMAKATLLFILTCCLIFVSSADNTLDLGVNWGIQTTFPLKPKAVVQMLKDNGIKRVKLFDADDYTVSALSGSGLEVMIGIPNLMLSTVADYEKAEDWVKENVTDNLDQNINIKYVAVGNEPFLTSYNGSFLKTTFPALQNIQKALNEAGYGDKIKAVVPQNAEVYEAKSNKPSDGNWRPDINDLMNKMVHFLDANKAPFVVNIYPFLSLYQNPDFPRDFAFFDGHGETKNDKGLQYSNVFDANYDTLIWTLKKSGIKNLNIMVGEIGWPTDGHIMANNNYAKKFYDGLLKRMASREGTPLHPDPLQVYLFSLFDENLKSIAPGYFERHWGVLTYDGKPKFALDLTGQGRNVYPVPVKGVEYRQSQWCVIDNQATKINNETGKEVDYACGESDCSRLVYGASCNKLNKAGNASYAFNMYFQMKGQKEDACDFGGLGQIVNTNPSKGTCNYELALKSKGEKLRLTSGISIIAGVTFVMFTLV